MNMNITGAAVLFSVIWFLTFYIVLQVRARTQDDVGDVVPGTPAGAPANEDVGKSAKIATLWAVVIWGALSAIILSGVISLHDFNIFKLYPPGQAPGEGGAPGE